MKKEAETDEVVKTLKAYLRDHRLTRQQFALRIGRSEGTVHKMLIGIYSQSILRHIETKTKISFGENARIVSKSSPDTGSYNRADYEYLTGSYTLTRKSDIMMSIIDEFPLTIQWHEFNSCFNLCDEGGQSLGPICIPNQAPCMFIPSNDQGWCRLITLSKVSTDGKLLGTLTTLGDDPGGYYRPQIFSIILRKLEGKVPPQRTLRRGDEGFDALERELSHTETPVYQRGNLLS